MLNGANEDIMYAPGACQLDLIVTEPGITAHTHIISVHAESASKRVTDVFKALILEAD